MLTVLFVILMIIVFAKVAKIAFKAAWGLTKVVFTLAFLPMILVVMAFSGFMILAVVALFIGGLVALAASAVV